MSPCLNLKITLLVTKHHGLLTSLSLGVCLSCQALMPESQRISMILYNQLKVSALDCTVHKGLSKMYNIQAYPLTLVPNSPVFVSMKGITLLNRS
ncbi:rCG37573 [Rattus norvegicus]|uniref:RCG37573 n=1 Tax=Rattus norvegicus TaxID=10116 RepID=A6K810_RAT|nr:rCG37573 [Rattus norvegicus]